MSRIGKNPVEIPAGVEVNLDGKKLSVKGPKGTLELNVHERMKVTVSEKDVVVERQSDQTIDKSLHGLTRTLIANMVQGVTEGYQKKLEIHGVGYRGQMNGNKLVLNLGFSHPVEVVAPEGITITVEENIITVAGIDKAKVGEIAAVIRSFRKPEPYKGKGVRYVDEHVRRKEGKKAATA